MKTQENNAVRWVRMVTFFMGTVKPYSEALCVYL